jgi:hypothetical protein
MSVPLTEITREELTASHGFLAPEAWALLINVARGCCVRVSWMDCAGRWGWHAGRCGDAAVYDRWFASLSEHAAGIL